MRVVVIFITALFLFYGCNSSEKFISQVARVEFDIDNTGEHLTMTKISANVWQQDELRAPTATTYPRIDTFTFSAVVSFPKFSNVYKYKNEY